MSDLGRCRETLYIRKHKIILVSGAGYRCKYCGRSYIHLKREENLKERERRSRSW